MYQDDDQEYESFKLWNKKYVILTLVFSIIFFAGSVVSLLFLVKYSQNDLICFNNVDTIVTIPYYDLSGVLIQKGVPIVKQMDSNNNETTFTINYIGNEKICEKIGHMNNYDFNIYKNNPKIFTSYKSNSKCVELLISSNNINCDDDVIISIIKPDNIDKNETRHHIPLSI